MHMNLTLIYLWSSYIYCTSAYMLAMKIWSSNFFWFFFTLYSSIHGFKHFCLAIKKIQSFANEWSFSTKLVDTLIIFWWLYEWDGLPDAGQTNRKSFNVDKSNAPTLNLRRRIGRRRRRNENARVAQSESRIDKSSVKRSYICRCKRPIWSLI